MCGPPDLVALADLTRSSAGVLVLGTAGGFLIGSVPFAWLIGRARGVDLRKVGSGNVGATNLARSAGLPLGVVAFILDAGKGAVPVLGARLAGGDEGAQVLAGGAAVLGHCFTPFLGGRGGKGVATMAGTLAVLAPRSCLALLAVWTVALAALRTVGIASTLTAVAALAIGIAFLVSVRGSEPRPALGLFLVLLSSLVVFRHRSNIRRWFSRRVEERG